jgi:hypothetical protein
VYVIVFSFILFGRILAAHGIANRAYPVKKEYSTFIAAVINYTAGFVLVGLIFAQGVMA